MSYIFTDFLISLADINKLKGYMNDPKGYMTSVGLTENQQKAIKNGDLYKIRRYSALEMKDDSVHAKLLNTIFEEKDPHFEMNLAFSEARKVEIPVDVDSDQNVEQDHNIVQTHDLGDDIAEFSSKYNSTNYYDHIFDENWTQSQNN